MTTREYTLTKPVTIAGKKHFPPARVPLDDRQSDWLAKQGAIFKPGIVATPPQAAAQTMPARRSGGCGCGR